MSEMERFHFDLPDCISSIDNRPQCSNCGNRAVFLYQQTCSQCRHSGKTGNTYLQGIAHDSVNAAIEQCENNGYEVTGIVGMFSGGNDSTTLAHLFKDKVTHYGHANTGFGIEETREYVRETSRQWGIPLLERFPEAGYGYRELVLGLCKSRTWYAKYPLVFPGGFPGPAQHAMMFQRLKERGMGQIRNEFNVNPRNQRVIFLGGRRASESSRRSFRYDAGELSYIETRGSIVWVSPILEWDKLDLNEYRRRNPEIPRNETSDLLHMSGECECGCYAHEGEYEEIRMWRPKMADEIDDLENELAAKDLDVNPKTLKWGWNQRGKCNTGLCNS